MWAVVNLNVNKCIMVVVVLNWDWLRVDMCEVLGWSHMTVPVINIVDGPSNT